MKIPLDLIFLVDTTGSMRNFINVAKKFMANCVEQITHTKKVEVFTSIIDYRDHPPEDNSYPAKIQANRVQQISTLQSIIQSLRLGQGGDYAESGLDAIDYLNRITWETESIRIAFFIGDAPILGTQIAKGYYNFSGSTGRNTNNCNFHDYCRCGLTLKDAFRTIEKYNITMYGYATHDIAKTSFGEFCSEVYLISPQEIFNEVLNKTSEMVDLYNWSINTLLPALKSDPYEKVSVYCEQLETSLADVNKGIEILNKFGLTDFNERR